MTLIKSISGIRGTIGGAVGSALTPIDVVKFAAAFGTWAMAQNPKNKKIVVGRDARISGNMVQGLVVHTLIGLGIDVVDADLSTTPTVEMAVVYEQAAGGIILTASHNPKQWNALKLLNSKGEFIDADNGAAVLQIAENNDFHFADIDHLGKYTRNDTFIARHIQDILNLPLVDVNAIKAAKFEVVIDCINSTGGIALPPLLAALGVAVVHPLHCAPTGNFAHNPEPLPENLTEISALVIEKKADLGIVVDPDVDRLCFVCNDGSMFGEEYTLVAIADYVLKTNGGGNTVSNLSSTRVLQTITQQYGGTYTASAVGEVNVVNAMRATNAIIGGEGNGGVIYPTLHAGRDAMLGIALFLTHLALSQKTCLALRQSYPQAVISKNKVELTPDTDIDGILEKVKITFAHEKINTIDGVRIDFEQGWVHLRKSNTEPIVRIYAEATTETEANALAQKIMAVMQG
jgi:phosphomannomutase